MGVEGGRSLADRTNSAPLTHTGPRGRPQVARVLLAKSEPTAESETPSWESLNMHVDRGHGAQTMYKYRTLTLNLKQPAQKANPLSVINNPEASLCQTRERPDPYL